MNGDNVRVTQGSRAAIAALYAAAIFVNAFLLFQVQPVIGKVIVPWFGGAAAVWTVCLLFFQSALLLGYLYAHWLARLRWGGRIHAGLLAVSLLTLPILPKNAWKPTAADDPSLRILLLLAVTVGLPYVLLSATSPLLQAWWARSRGTTPYRWYALSNAGSMLALLSYPVLIEPRLTTVHQSLVWSLTYVAAAALCAFIAWREGRAQPVVVAQTGATAGAAGAPTIATKALWLALAACGSALLVSITTHVTQNIASVPLLWIVPLALYLLSFILCFDGPR
jgi:hypothetical protein